MNNIQQLAKEFQKITEVSPQFDGILSVLKKEMVVDMVRLDEALSEHDQNYDNENCIFNGKENVSMEMYLQEKFGDRAVQIARQFVQI